MKKNKFDAVEEANKIIEQAIGRERYAIDKQLQEIKKEIKKEVTKREFKNKLNTFLNWGLIIGFPIFVALLYSLFKE